LRSTAFLVALVIVLIALLVFAVSLPYAKISSSPKITGTGRQQPIVPTNEIVAGGPPPEGIPSIDSPKFLNSSQANYLTETDEVVGIYYNGVAKAYPLQILVWHEIVNDMIGSTPVAVTYCPLCFSTLAFIRQIDGVTVTFGTSGKLYNNNLVMYDRLTKSYWSQMWGEAIAGNLTGYMLTKLPIDVMLWAEWKSLYPNTLVLSRDTGSNRPYGEDPYLGYYTSPVLLFPLSSNFSKAFSPKTIVLGLSINNVNKSYSFEAFNQTGIVADSVGNQKVVFFVRELTSARAFSPVLDGRSLSFQYLDGTYTDIQTHSVWNYDGVAVSGPFQGKILTRFVTITSFWFAWATFYSNTLVYTPKS